MRRLVEGVMGVMFGRSRALLVAGLLGCSLFAAAPAHAWWRGGFFIGLPPVVIAPAPVYAPPPAYYYAPPPAYYPPPPAYYGAPAPAPEAQNQPQSQPQKQVAYGYMCYAGAYRCALANYAPIGNGCSCPGLGAPSYGIIR